MSRNRYFIWFVYLLFVALGVGQVFGQPLLDPSTLTKYMDPLPIPGVVQPVGKLQGAPYYEIRMIEFKQKLHSELDSTSLWGYNGFFPGPTIEAWRNQRIKVRWINDLPLDHLLPVDTTIHGAGYPENPYVRTVVHLHGGNVPPESDGYPEDWFTPGQNDLYEYPNRQQATTLWFHDHALGITRINVYAGLAAFYLLRDINEEHLNLPKDAYEIPIVIQDRTFYEDGELFYPEMWEPEFFGDVAVVNGKVWPNLIVEPRKYRFRFLNGSNSRFYNLKLLESDSYGNVSTDSISGPAFYQIGSDGGLLAAPVKFNDPINPFSPRLLTAPGERHDVVIDFAGKQGKYFLLHNNAKTPFKGLGSPAEDEVPLPEIMLIKVKNTIVEDNSSLPMALNNIISIPEVSAVEVRDLTLEEVMDTLGMVQHALLNGMMWDDPITERPQLGTAEIWRIINLTEDVHPIHLHLVQFQILDRQPFDVDHYMATGELIFTGPPMPPDPNERGWKDTHRAHPAEVTRFITRFDSYAGLFVWHCHILEHEDNEMMRPFEVVVGVADGGMNMPKDVNEPLQLTVGQNYPEPFKALTNISFNLPNNEAIELTIYNILGEEVRTLAKEVKDAGVHTYAWDGTNKSGSKVAAGIYFYKLIVGNNIVTKKMTLLK
ncbi:MAG: multicopper oxidase domain-containing protein [bacterium]